MNVVNALFPAVGWGLVVSAFHMSLLAVLGGDLVIGAVVNARRWGP